MLSNKTNRTLEAGTNPVQTDSVPLSEELQPISAVVRRGIAYWQKLRGARAWPLRADVRPEEIAGLLPYTYMLDVLDDGRDFRYRLLGTDIVANTVRDNTGECLSRLREQGSQPVLARFFQDCHTSREPRLQRIPFITRLGIRCWYEAVAMPLARTDGTAPDLIMGFAEHFNEVID